MDRDTLIRLLEDLPEGTEIRFMSQPNWPFEYSIRPTLFAPEATCAECGYAKSDGVHDSFPGAGSYPYEDAHPFEEDFTPNGTPTNVAYLVEGTQLGYGTKRAWDEY